jgi:hypothetical protein
MFEQARSEAVVDTDLLPYWIYEGSVRVERRVPTLPFSREVTRLALLKRSLTVLLSANRGRTTCWTTFRPWRGLESDGIRFFSRAPATPTDRKNPIPQNRRLIGPP